ncbi:MAG: hypothetical protein ACE5FW_00170 [Candidatus Aenigmatarchaeota archaeon]
MATGKDYYVTVCPKCGSDNIKSETNPAYAITGLLTQFKQCGNCGHHGQVFPESPKSEVLKKPKSAKKVEEKDLVQVSFGRGYFKYLVYIAVPLLILSLIGLIMFY